MPGARVSQHKQVRVVDILPTIHRDVQSAWKWLPSAW